MKNVLSVIQLNIYIKRLFEQDYVLKNVEVEGELSNFKKHSSGHIYFTLKDDKAAISSVLFRSYLSNVDENLKNGDKVVVTGSVSLYEKTGQYQIYVRKIEKSGQGDLHLLFEQLKQKLLSEGLFDSDYKREIPKYAQKIGIITSGTGAAIKDIIQVAKRRNPYIELVLYPSLVQGDEAKFNIVKGIEYFNNVNRVDVLIVGRGGGSIEDLWPFNEEMVARAIYESNIPIISAVGHETDFTIADFVSDLRVPTPSAAAEIAVYDFYEIEAQLNRLRDQLDQKIERVIDIKKDQLAYLKIRLSKTHPRVKIEEKYHLMEELRLKLNRNIRNNIDYKKSNLLILSEKLHSRSPMKRLEDGYGYLSHNGKHLLSVKSLEKGDVLDVMLLDGKIKSIVNEIEVL